MNESEKKEKQAFFIRFSKSSSISIFRKLCSKVLKRTRCAFLDAEYKPLKRGSECNHLKIGKYLASFRSSISREYMVFKCSCNKICLSFPVIQGSSVYGHVLFTHLDREPNKRMIDAVRICMDLALKEFQKEQELNKQINEQSSKLQEANNAINQKQTDITKLIRSGSLRLQATGCVQNSSSSTPTSGSGNTQGSESDRATLEAIAEIIAQGDRNTAQLNTCIAAYNKVMETVNGQR